MRWKTAQRVARGFDGAVTRQQRVEHPRRGRGASVAARVRATGSFVRVCGGGLGSARELPAGRKCSGGLDSQFLHAQEEQGERAPYSDIGAVTVAIAADRDSSDLDAGDRWSAPASGNGITRRQQDRKS